MPGWTPFFTKTSSSSRWEIKQYCHTIISQFTGGKNGRRPPFTVSKRQPPARLGLSSYDQERWCPTSYLIIRISVRRHPTGQVNPPLAEGGRAGTTFTDFFAIAQERIKMLICNLLYFFCTWIWHQHFKFYCHVKNLSVLIISVMSRTRFSTSKWQKLFFPHQ